MDERFMLHQMRAMKAATRTGAVLFGVLLLYRYFMEGVLDWQLLAILLVMGVVKVGMLIYLRRTN